MILRPYIVSFTFASASTTLQRPYSDAENTSRISSLVTTVKNLLTYLAYLLRCSVVIPNVSIRVNNII